MRGSQGERGAYLSDPSSSISSSVSPVTTVTPSSSSKSLSSAEVIFSPPPPPALPALGLAFLPAFFGLRPMFRRCSRLCPASPVARGWRARGRRVRRRGRRWVEPGAGGGAADRMRMALQESTFSHRSSNARTRREIRMVTAFGYDPLTVSNVSKLRSDQSQVFFPRSSSGTAAARNTASRRVTDLAGGATGARTRRRLAASSPSSGARNNIGRPSHSG